MKKLLPAFLALLALSAPAANDGAAVYRPGLVQWKVPVGSPFGFKASTGTVPVLASNLLANAKSDQRDRTLDVFKDGGHADDYVNPVSGKSWPWNPERGYAVFAYEGEMFVEEGVDYYMYGRFWTGEALVVDGTTAVWQGSGNGWNYPPEIYGYWTAPKTGWVPFNAWIWTWNGAGSPQWSTWALEYNLDGVVVEGMENHKREIAQNSTTNVWRRFADPGNGTFLRTDMGERFTTVVSSDEAEGGRTFNLSFANVPSTSRLVALSGPADGHHETNAWRDVSAVLAEVPPGTSTTNVVVPLATDATVLRFRLAHFNPDSTDGLENFEEWTEMVPVTAAPVLGIDSILPGYTNAVVAGTIGSFGLEGTEATVTLQVSEESDTGFAHPVSSNVLAAVTAVGAFEAEVSGLLTNTAYLVRAMATNQLGAVGFSEAVPFSTREPGPASLSVEPSICALFFAELRATVSDWGGGSWDVKQAWIDVSEDDSFPAGATQALPLGELSGATPVSATATATDLEMSHGYFARVRAVNSWGVESVSETLAFSTSDKPIGFPEEATVVAERGKVTASLAPTFVTEGTVYNVTLRMEGIVGTRSWPNQTGFGPFVHTQLTADGAEVVFVYSVEWTLGDKSGTIEVRGRAVSRLADRTIRELAEIDPAVSGIYLRPGDMVELEPASGIRIDWHTNAVLSILPTNGVYLLTALEPGAALLYETDATTWETNNVTGVAIVLPSENPPGGIYVRRTLATFDWNDSAAWEMVAEGPQGYPNAAGAYAYIATPELGLSAKAGVAANITEPVTVGYLAVGQLGWIHHDLRDKSHWPWIFQDPDGNGLGSLHFETADGSPSWVRFLGHSYVTSKIEFNVPLYLENDCDFDELNRVQDTTGWSNTRERGVYFKRPVDVGTNTFRTVRANPYPYHYGTATWDPAKNRYESHTSGLEERGWISFWNDVRGSGTMRLEAATLFGLRGTENRVKSFTGVWDVANGDLNPHVNANYGAASLNVTGGSIGNAREMIVRGSWHRAEKTWPRGALVRTGFSTGKDCTTAWTNDWQNALPPKITLDGGCLQLYPQGSGASGIRRNLFSFDEFVVPAGPMGRLEAKWRGNNTTYPHVRTTITNLVLETGSVVSFDYDAGGTNASNDLFVVNEPVGWMDPTPGQNRQFLPYFFANNQREGTGGNTIELMTAEALDNTRLAFRDLGTGKVTLGSPETEGNGFRRWTEGETLADGAQYCSMQLASNVTNAFAKGAVVKNLSGYLDMRKGSSLGRPGADSDATLDFGDQPARLYVGNWDETGTIGCKLVGTAGLVKGGNGILALAASADGVAGGVRVAGGTLVLGAMDEGGTNRVGRVAGDVVVEAGSRLVVGIQKSFAPHVRLFLNDRDWIPSYAHVRLESKAYVDEIFVDGEPLRHGWHGSSESDAQFVDDAHFEGPGMIYAGKIPTMMILR